MDDSFFFPTSMMCTPPPCLEGNSGAFFVSAEEDRGRGACYAVPESAVFDPQEPPLR